jgi:SAM-dependent methyltransferase
MSSQRPATQSAARQRIVHDYFEVTSAASLQEGRDYKVATAGLARGLGPWLDVDGKSVLDLGSGTGELCWLALDRGASEVVGVNLSQGEVDYSSNHVKACFVCADVLKYLEEAKTASVDRIYALNLLEHLPEDTLVEVLEQSQRVLAPGGALVAMVPNATSPFGGMTRYWDFTHFRAFTPSSVRQLTRLTGFADADFREWGPRPHGVVSMVRFVLWQGIRYLIATRLLIETGSTKGKVYTADMLFRLWR